MANAAYLPLAAERPEYALSKGAGTLAMQYVAQEVSPDRIQVVSFHPGIVYSGAWSSAGVAEDFIPFDDGT